MYKLINLFLFNIKSNICNFAVDNSLYFCKKTLEMVISNLEYDLLLVLDYVVKHIYNNEYSSKLSEYRR